MNTAAAASFAPTVAEGVAWVDLGGEAVILDGRRGLLHHLNPSATVAWLCFDGTTTIDALAADLADTLNVGMEAVRSDLQELVRALAAVGLLDGFEPARRGKR